MTPGYWWLSFADDSGFLGACIVYGDDAIDAVRMSHDAKCNPGGEVLILRLGDFATTTDMLGEFEMNRLYSLREIEARGGAVKVKL